MNRIIATIVLAIAALATISPLSLLAQQGQATHVRTGASLPATCIPGDIFTVNTGGTDTPYFCKSTNTWQAFSSAGTFAGGIVTGDAFFKTGVPWADVMAYGAVGNGSTVDTTAVGSAYTTVCALGGGTVYFPANHTFKFAWPTLSNCNGWVIFKYDGILSPTNTFTINEPQVALRGGAQATESGFFNQFPNGFITAASLSPVISVTTASANPVLIEGVGMDGCVGDCIQVTNGATTVRIENDYLRTAALSTGSPLNIDMTATSGGFNFWMSHDSFVQVSTGCSIKLVAIGQAFIENSFVNGRRICATVAPAGSGVTQLVAKQILSENLNDPALFAFDTTGGGFHQTTLENIEMADNTGGEGLYLASNTGGNLDISVKASRGFTSAVFNKISGTIIASVDDTDGYGLGNISAANDSITDIFKGELYSPTGGHGLGGFGSTNYTLSVLPTTASKTALNITGLSGQNTNPLFQITPNASHSGNSNLFEIDYAGTTTPEDYIDGNFQMFLRSQQGATVPLTIAEAAGQSANDITLRDSSFVSQGSLSMHAANCGRNDNTSTRGWQFNGTSDGIAGCFGIATDGTHDLLSMSFAATAGSGTSFEQGLNVYRGYGLFGTNDLLVEGDAASTGWTAYEGVFGLGVILSTGTATPVSVRPNRTETFRFLSGGGGNAVGAGTWDFSPSTTLKAPALQAVTYSTATNCLAAGSNAAASAVACGSAAAGMFSVPVTTPTTVVVTTTALTANSEIFIQQRLDTTNGAGAALSVTCNTNTNATAPNVTARAATTFTFAVSSFSVNPGCYEYRIVN